MQNILGNSAICAGCKQLRKNCICKIDYSARIKTKDVFIIDVFSDSINRTLNIIYCEYFKDVKEALDNSPYSENTKKIQVSFDALQELVKTL